MTTYDYAVLVFYFGYMLAISWVFRKFVTNVSEYFRGGGKALWWMVGGSAFRKGTVFERMYRDSCASMYQPALKRNGEGWTLGDIGWERGNYLRLRLFLWVS